MKIGARLMLARCWAHVKGHFDEIAPQEPSACAGMVALIGEFYAIERLVSGPFPGAPLHWRWGSNCARSAPTSVLDPIRQWATVQVGLSRSDFGGRHMLDRCEGLTSSSMSLRVPPDKNAAARALRGPVVGRKNRYGSWSLRGTQVSALFCTLCKTATLSGVDARAYLRRALHTAIAGRCAVTHPQGLFLERQQSSESDLKDKATRCSEHIRTGSSRFPRRGV
jgi:transposase